MPENPSTWSALWQDLVNHALAQTALWGAAGGLTNVLLPENSRLTARRLLRQLLLGALIAGGLGSLAGALVARWTGLPVDQIPSTGGFAAAAYLAGVFGGAILELILTRLRAGRLPIEGGDK